MRRRRPAPIRSLTTGHRRGACALVIIATSTGACAGSITIPYDLEAVATRTRPVHPIRVAVLPFEDARSAADGSDAAAGFRYHGIDLTHTNLDRVRHGPSHAMAEIVARHLARRRSFAQIILVRRAEDAPEADLLIRGRLRRARGYVQIDDEANAATDEERAVVAEVLLGPIELRTRDAGGQRVLLAEVGWAIFDKRPASPQPPSPWAILGEALLAAVEQLADAIERADLSGEVVVADRVSLPEATATMTAGAFGSLPVVSPPGWRFVVTSSASAPIGWKGSPVCDAAELRQQQAVRFHRVLGPYVPTVRLWACPPSARLKYDSREEFPSEYLGRRAGGARPRYFLHAVGQSNWPTARSQIRTRLDIAPPPVRHVFEVGPD